MYICTFESTFVLPYNVVHVRYGKFTFVRKYFVLYCTSSTKVLSYFRSMLLIVQYACTMRCTNCTSVQTVHLYNVYICTRRATRVQLYTYHTLTTYCTIEYLCSIFVREYLRTLFVRKYCRTSVNVRVHKKEIRVKSMVASFQNLHQLVWHHV
jgi:hypothetical protein